MILGVLVIAGIALAAFAAFVAVVAGVQATERRQSLDDPSRDGPAARLARRLLAAHGCKVDGHRDAGQNAPRKQVRA
jgi:hypothetical protein